MKPTLLTALLLAPLVVASLARPAQAASPAAEANARLLAQVEPRIKAIYETNEFAVRSFRATWLPDGSGYLKLKTPAGVSGGEVASYDSASGKRYVLLVEASTKRWKEKSLFKLEPQTTPRKP